MACASGAILAESRPWCRRATGYRLSPPAVERLFVRKERESMHKRLRPFALIASLALALFTTSTARAADVSAPVLLVATPELREFYGGTVLMTRPVGDGRHIGFILNRPTPLTLGKLFPEHPPSTRIAEPVFLGGPEFSTLIFAVVQRSQSPSRRSIPLTSDLFLAVDRETVDAIIEKEPDHARFFAGLVAWQPGELQRELDEGCWYTLEPDAGVVLRKSTEGLWEELVKRSKGTI
jgi:putative AlgH/UPF0301 family transcriptional regulator